MNPRLGAGIIGAELTRLAAVGFGAKVVGQRQRDGLGGNLHGTTWRPAPRRRSWRRGLLTS